MSGDYKVTIVFEPFNEVWESCQRSHSSHVCLDELKWLDRDGLNRCYKAFPDSAAAQCYENFRNGIINGFTPPFNVIDAQAGWKKCRQHRSETTCLKELEATRVQYLTYCIHVANQGTARCNTTYDREMIRSQVTQ